MKISKKLLALIVVISGIVGFFVVLPVHYVLEETSTDRFCGVCHEMDPMVISYQKDIHAGSGAIGVKAKCVDCHLPHDNLAKYVYQKAVNGIVEGYIHFFGDPDSINWVANLKNKEHYVFDNGCMSCHTNILDTTASSQQAQKMHAHYVKLQGSDKELKCVSCHVGVGHAHDMRNQLEYWKPSYKIYENKMLEQKIKSKQEFFKDEYEPTKQEREFLEKNVKKPANSH
ncbi:cytochrome c3 family protein [Campylobacter californiensis]|nr:NapC/NirT family cytochrome c [Campylobacter sp. RM6914]QCD51653.1 NapC/NirT cytochrome c family protein [Campylobacter sp. RM6914]